MLKKILIGLGVLVVLIAGGLYYVWSNAGSYIKTALEHYGSQATQTTVKVDKVGLSPFGGEASLSGISIGNPKGYATPSAFALNQVGVKVDIGTVRSNTIVVKEINIDRPQITYEAGGTGGSNLQALQKNVQDYAAKMGGGSAPQKPAGSSSEPEKKLIIENLYVRNGQIAASHSALKGQVVNTALPTIHLTNIGKAKGGATPAEVANEVIGAISAQAAKVAAADLTKQLDLLKGAIPGGIPGGAGTGGGMGDQLRGLMGK